MFDRPKGHRREWLSESEQARVGQKGRLCHRWWLKGQRPPGVCDQRFDWTYIFAAAEPATGAAFALVLPTVSIKAMNRFLEDEHALMGLDGDGGWAGNLRS